MAPSRSRMVDVPGKVLTDHDNAHGNTMCLLEIVRVHPHDIVLEGGIRGQLREIGGRVVGTRSPEVACATGRVVVTTTSHLLHGSLSGFALEEWSHCGKTGTDNGDRGFNDDPVEDGGQTICRNTLGSAIDSSTFSTYR